jgi:NAD(P)-dependent dehydrogenase (short-subunit alcohol dehydrogenase family)
MTERDSQRCIIVGGTSGIGWATAEILAARGAHVALIGRDGARARDAASRLSPLALGEGADDEGLEAAVTRAVAALGGLDGIACTAGPIAVRGDLLALSDEAWRESFETQLMTVVRSARAAVPAMIAGGGGAFVATSAYSIRAPKAELAHYTAMKAAIPIVTKSLAKTYGTRGIRANCVAPGAVATRSIEGVADADRWRHMRETYGMKAGLDRIGEPREVGELIAFLLSDEAAYLSGATINIDGGTDF